MDPDANLREALEIADRLVMDKNPTTGKDLVDAERLAELVLGLDRWIRSGGFLPGIWIHT